MSAGKSCYGGDMQKHVINFHTAEVPDVVNEFFMIFVRLKIQRERALIYIIILERMLYEITKW